MFLVKLPHLQLGLMHLQLHGSEALAPAAGRAPQAALVQAEGFATQQRLALQAGEMLLMPGHPLCPLKLLREDDLRDKHTLLISAIPPGRAARGSGTETPRAGGGAGPGCHTTHSTRSAVSTVPRAQLLPASTEQPACLPSQPVPRRSRRSAAAGSRSSDARTRQPRSSRSR